MTKALRLSFAFLFAFLLTAVAQFRPDPQPPVPRVIPAQSTPTEAERRRVTFINTEQPAPHHDIPKTYGPRQPAPVTQPTPQYHGGKPQPPAMRPPQPQLPAMLPPPQPPREILLRQPPKPPKPQVKSTPKGWYDDYNAASMAARQTGRPIFVLFTGSDWCGWCKKLRKDVLDRHDFKELADRELILMFVDSPHGFDLPRHVRRANEMLAHTLDAGNGVPHAVLVAPNGKKLGEISGYRKEKDYLKELRKLLRKK